jgi:MFS family permease
LNNNNNNKQFINNLKNKNQPAMMKTTLEKIEVIKKNGYQLDFANVFNHTFENYKKIALYAGLMIFVFSILMGVIVSGVVIVTIGASALNQHAIENLKPENFTVSYMAIYIISLLVLTCLLSPFVAGLIKMAHCAEKDEEFHVATAFEYYKAPYFKEIITATFLIALLGSVLPAIIEFSGIKFVSTLITMVVSFLTFLTIPLIIFGDLKAIDAIKSSAIIVSKQPLVLIGLLIVGGIASMVGFIGCCIGVFFTIPFIYSMYYAIYTAIIGIDSETELQ